MKRLIIPIITILLAIGLITFIVEVKKEEDKKNASYEELDNQRRPLAVQLEKLEKEMRELEKSYETAVSPNALAQVVFTSLDKRVFNSCYPIMKEFDYQGVLVVSPKNFPGNEGCMTTGQFKTLINEGWEVAVEWQVGLPVDQWIPELQTRFAELNVQPGDSVYFPKGTYRSYYDKRIQTAGFFNVINKTPDGEIPLQKTYEETVWHVGSVGLMSTKPRTWLNEAVAQQANITFLVGFSEADELYNEKSFRSMLNCFQDYENTAELIVTTVEEARGQYHSRLLGLDSEFDIQYQQQKAELQAKIDELQKQLDQLDAKY